MADPLAHLVGLKLPHNEALRLVVGGAGDWNRFATRDDAVLWWRSAADARAAARSVVPSSHSVSNDAADPATCDVAALLAAVSGPDGSPTSEHDLLTTIDLLDDLEHQVAALTRTATRAGRASLAFVPVRNALFDGRSWNDAVVIGKYVDGLLAADALHGWADALESREDIAYETGGAEQIAALIFELANPEITRPWSRARAAEWMERLEV